MEIQIKNLEKRISSLDSRVPDSFEIYYKPPGFIEHQKLNLTLDHLYGKINKIEDDFYQNGNLSKGRG